MYIFAFFASSHLRSLTLRCFFSVSILNELCISLKWKFVPYWRQGCYVSVLLIKLIFQICDLRWINLIWQFWWCGDIFCICRYRGSWGVTIEKVWNKGVIWILRTQINNFVEYLVKLFTSWTLYDILPFCIVWIIVPFFKRLSIHPSTLDVLMLVSRISLIKATFVKSSKNAH